MRRFLLTTAFMICACAAQAGEIFRDQAPQSQLNITSSTLVKPTSGMLVGFAVTVFGSGAGTINDAASTGAAAASNAMVALPTTASSTTYFPMQFKNGLVVVPGTGQTITVSYQ
jgi:hypothetical protein